MDDDSGGCLGPRPLDLAQFKRAADKPPGAGAAAQLAGMLLSRHAGHPNPTVPTAFVPELSGPSDDRVAVRCALTSVAWSSADDLRLRCCKALDHASPRGRRLRAFRELCGHDDGTIFAASHPVRGLTGDGRLRIDQGQRDAVMGSAMAALVVARIAGRVEFTGCRRPRYHARSAVQRFSDAPAGVRLAR